MFQAIRNRFNWHSRKTRALVAAAVCAAGLGIGFVGSVVLKASEPPPPSIASIRFSAQALHVQRLPPARALPRIAPQRLHVANVQIICSYVMEIVQATC